MTLTQINKAGLDELALDHVFTIGASGSSAYTFQGEGLNGTVNNPTLYLVRGKTYRFENGTGAHPIRIQSTSGASGTAYNTGVTNNAGSGTVIVEVQHDSPDVLYYQCTSHAAMNGILYTVGALADGGVTTAKLADNSVTAAKLSLSAGEINGSTIADDTINSNHYVNGSIDTAHIADANVTTAKIADDAVTDAKLANSINSAIAANTAKNTNATHTGDVTGSGSLTIASNAVTTAKIADDAVTGAKIAHGTVAEINLQTNGVTTAKIADDAVTSAKIADNTITAGNIAADAVGASEIADNAVDADRLQSNAVTTAKIADDAVTSAKIADGTIVAANIANDTITAVQLANNSANVNVIVDGAVTTDKIANNAVLLTKIQDVQSGSILGRQASGGGDLQELGAANIRAMINVADGATAGGGSIKKVASRRYYGFEQTTGIGNAGFTKMTKAFVTITPSSSSNSIKLSGTMNWSGSDTENQYSFRWRREISGGATTSLDGDLGSGTRPGIQFRLLGNGDVATMLLGPVIDQPNTTSAITYYIEAFVDGANQSVYLNRGQNDSNDPRYERAASYFIAEELDNSAHTHTNTNS